MAIQMFWSEIILDSVWGLCQEDNPECGPRTYLYTNVWGLRITLIVLSWPAFIVYGRPHKGQKYTGFRSLLLSNLQQIIQGTSTRTIASIMCINIASILFSKALNNIPFLGFLL